jgi:hypothetical protein
MMLSWVAENIPSLVRKTFNGRVVYNEVFLALDAFWDDNVAIILEFDLVHGR